MGVIFGFGSGLGLKTGLRFGMRSGKGWQGGGQGSWVHAMTQHDCGKEPDETYVIESCNTTDASPTGILNVECEIDRGPNIHILPLKVCFCLLSILMVSELDQGLLPVLNGILLNHNNFQHLSIRSEDLVQTGGFCHQSTPGDTLLRLEGTKK